MYVHLLVHWRVGHGQLHAQVPNRWRGLRSTHAMLPRERAVRAVPAKRQACAHALIYAHTSVDSRPCAFERACVRAACLCSACSLPVYMDAGCWCTCTQPVCAHACRLAIHMFASCLYTCAKPGPYTCMPPVCTHACSVAGAFREKWRLKVEGVRVVKCDRPGRRERQPTTTPRFFPFERPLP